MSDPVTISATVDMDVEPQCEYHRCDNTPSVVYHGLDSGNGEIYLYVAGYCQTHSKTHAEPNEHLARIGTVKELMNDA